MEIPSSENTVGVRVIDTTSHLVVPNDFVAETIKGNEFLDCPCLSFLIEHPSGRRLLFDLGIRKDFDVLPPLIQQYFKDTNAKVSVEKDVHQLLEENDVDPNGIEAIVWSHWHFDHLGDPSKFGSSTALIVGPGFTESMIPGYPENPMSPVLQADYAGRELRELDFKGPDAIKIGDFDALDYFGDGSFFILDGPGHTVGHICALARTTASPPSFILMGADACHHLGEIRPSEWFPFPSEICPNPIQRGRYPPCPGAVFEHLLRNGDRTFPFYSQKRPGGILSDVDAAERTIEKLQMADGQGNIFVMIAHDTHLKGVIDFFPQSVNDFMAKGWHTKSRWAFLSDFKDALLENPGK